MKKNPNWTNFLYYASLIQYVKCNADDIEPSLLPFLYSAIGSRTPVLCSLKEILWFERRAPDSDLFFLIGHLLQRLSLEISDSCAGSDYSDWFARLASRLALVCPNLRTLEINARNIHSGDREFKLPSYFRALHSREVQLVNVDSACRFTSVSMMV